MKVRSGSWGNGSSNGISRCSSSSNDSSNSSSSSSSSVHSVEWENALRFVAGVGVTLIIVVVAGVMIVVVIQGFNPVEWEQA